jgi:hypothetical protein
VAGPSLTEGIEGQVGQKQGAGATNDGQAVAGRARSTVTARAMMAASVSSGASATHALATAPERTVLFSTHRPQWPRDDA